ncbi:hypothetical protein ACS0TY_018212 [Phlomoides rotata]
MLSDLSDSEEVSSVPDSMEMEEDKDIHNILANSDPFYHRKDSLVHRSRAAKERDIEKSDSWEPPNTWVASLAAHEYSGNTKYWFRKDNQTKEPLEDSSTMNGGVSYTHGPALKVHAQAQLGQPEKLIIEAHSDFFKGGVSDTHGPALKVQPQAYLGHSEKLITEAHSYFNSLGPSSVSSPKTIEEVDSDPFALAPYIEEAFSKKLESHRKKMEKSESIKEKSINKRKAWADFLVEMDSGEESNNPIRKGKQKLRKYRKGKKGKPKSNDSSELRETGRVTPTVSDINKCNEAFWRRNCVEEAKLVFENSNLMGFSIEKDREILLPDLIAMEERDRGRMQAESGSKGASGGLITLWRNSVFALENQWGTSGVLAIKGTWQGNIKNFILINIYAPCGSMDQQRLWEDIQDWFAGQQDDLRCIFGDFNTVTNQSERKGGSRPTSDKKSSNFCKFIANLELVDLPLLRRKYTWYKDNGTCCSRIDRFFISQHWCSVWPNLNQFGLKGTFSDHAPILIESSDKENWGPILFKIVN